MSKEYFKSEKHIINAKKASKKGIEKLIQAKQIRVLEYNKKPKICLNCEQAIPYEKRLENKYCSRSCNAKHNNPTKGKKRDKNVRKKISLSLGGDGNVGEHGKVRITKIKTPDEQLLSDSELKSKRIKEFYQNNPEARIKQSEKAKNRCVSEETRQKLREMMRKRIQEGKHKGWASRNQPSYAEKFFIKVLNNNKLIYEYEKKVGKYFIDFAFNDKKIALEIDGQQHKHPDRIQKDKEKNLFLENNGWYVYRIEWKNINSISGSDYIKNEIKMFLEFLLTF